MEQDAQNGKKIYVDADARLTGLPPALQGSDYVQGSNADRLYSAADLIEIAVKAGSTVWVAHDNRLPRPSWLTGQFKPAGLVLTVDGRPMNVFQHRAGREESLTLGSNTDAGGVKECNMYVVFVNSAAPAR
jgi:beta-galactosidase